MSEKLHEEEIFDYFVNYEEENIYNQLKFNNNIKLKPIKNITRDFEKTRSEFFDYKEKRIKSEIVKRISGKRKNQDLSEIYNLLDLRDENFKVPVFIEKIGKYSFYYKKTFLDEIETLLRTNNFYIFSPFIKKTDKYYYNLLVIELKVQKIGIEMLDVNINMSIIKLILADLFDYNLAYFEKKYKDKIKLLNQIFEGVIFDNFSDVENFLIKKINNFFEIDFMSQLKSHKNYDYEQSYKLAFIDDNNIYIPKFKNEINKIKNREKSKLLKQYLRLEKVSRNEINLEKDFFYYGSYTSKYPANEKQSYVVKSITENKLLSILGPPGTGKTTVIKEIIADQLVKRVDAILDKIDAKWEKAEKDFYKPPYDNAHTMIVTSTNNQAVNNIGTSLLNEIEFFNECLPKDSAFKGIFAMKLGNKNNREKFIELNIKPLVEYLENIEEEIDIKPLRKEFYDLKNEIKTLNEAKEKYLIDKNMVKNLEIKNYAEFLEKKEFFISKNYDLDASIRSINTKKSILSSKNEKLLMENKKMENEIEDLKKIIRNQKECRLEYEQDERLYSEYLKYKNNVFLRAFLFFKTDLKEISKKYISIERIQDMVNEYTQDIDSKLEQEADKRNIIKNSNEIINSNIKEIDELELDLMDLNKEKDNTDKTLTVLSNYKDSEKVLKDKYNLKDRKFYSFKEINSSKKLLNLRKKLFDQSIRVLEAYIKLNRKEIVHNINKIFNETQSWFGRLYNNNEPYGEKKKESVISAWNTLFTCFPVMTVTLHSFNYENNFQMVRELYDLLLVDEAGQILPHYLIGPLQRSKRSVIVGDAKQLEPIRTVTDENIINKYDNIIESSTYCIHSNAAIDFADKASNIYEETSNKEQGLLLNEHRRCFEPIVHFSNKNVYNNKLKIIEDTEGKDDSLFNKSLVFIDVRSNKKVNRHVNDQEIEVIKNLVERYVEKFGENIKKDIGIITPFKHQANALKKIFPILKIGTVHTFQGQEREIIIFTTVFDGKNNLCDFIGGMPNLINVATTRAKREFVIVGNLNAMKKSNNYLKKLVETVEERGIIFSLYESFKHNNNEENQRLYMSLFSSNQTFQEDCFKFFDSGLLIGADKHKKFFSEIINMNLNKVAIISPWISYYRVKDNILDSIIKLGQDNKIDIFFGYRDANYSLKDIEDIIKVDYSNLNLRKQETLLKELNKNLGDNFNYIPPIHVKALLINEKYLVIGSYNWLSNNKETTDDEMSCVITNSESIEHFMDTFSI